MNLYLLPLPQKMKYKQGFFRFTGRERVTICGNNPEKERPIAKIVTQSIKKTLGFSLPIIIPVQSPQKRCINLVIWKSDAAESYSLDISEDTIIIRAST